jgi:hypothetical protein
VRRVNLAVFSARDPLADASAVERLALWPAPPLRAAADAAADAAPWPVSFARTWRGDAAL